MLSPVTILGLLHCFTPGWSVTIDSKLEVDPPPSLLVKNSNGELALDSSISPKVVKAFYEIHFVPATGPQDESGNGIVTVTTPQKCPFAVNTELCKYYFTPSKVVAVQRIDDLIEKSKEGTVPVVQGFVSTDKWDTDKFMKEVNDTINNKVNAVVPLHNKNKTQEVPVYTGTVNTQGVLNKPEFPPRLPPYRPYYPPPARPPYPWNSNGWNNCLQPPCPWRTPYSSQIL